MDLRSKKWINIALVIGIILLLFTPVGRYVRGFAGRLLSSGSAMVKSKLQLTVENYDWQLVDVNGKEFNFGTAKGKVILVNFWATWCPPCIAEMPSLQDLYNDYGDKIEFIFVAQDKTKKVTSFMKRKGYNLPVYYPKSEAPRLLTAKSIPTTYIIDKEGRIIVAQTGAADWNSEEVRKVIDSLLRE